MPTVSNVKYYKMYMPDGICITRANSPSLARRNMLRAFLGYRELAEYSTVERGYRTFDEIAYDQMLMAKIFPSTKLEYTEARRLAEEDRLQDGMSRLTRNCVLLDEDAPSFGALGIPEKSPYTSISIDPDDPKQYQQAVEFLAQASKEKEEEIGMHEDIEDFLRTRKEEKYPDA